MSSKTSSRAGMRREPRRIVSSMASTPPTSVRHGRVFRYPLSETRAYEIKRELESRVSDEPE